MKPYLFFCATSGFSEQSTPLSGRRQTKSTESKARTSLHAAGSFQRSLGPDPRLERGSPSPCPDTEASFCLSFSTSTIYASVLVGDASRRLDVSFPETSGRTLSALGLPVLLSITNSVASMCAIPELQIAGTRLSVRWELGCVSDSSSNWPHTGVCEACLGSCRSQALSAAKLL